jgi:hypothetical protein
VRSETLLALPSAVVMVELQRGLFLLAACPVDATAPAHHQKHTPRTLPRPIFL